MSKKVTVIVEGREYIVEVGDLNANPIQATVNQHTYQVEIPQKSAIPSPAQKPAPVKSTAPPQARPATNAAPPVNPGSAAITAPMPGDIIEVKVKPGDSVNPGDVVCVLEAMKMKNMIRAARAAVIGSVEVSAGQSVDFGAILVTFE